MRRRVGEPEQGFETAAGFVNPFARADFLKAAESKPAPKYVAKNCFQFGGRVKLRVI